MNLKGGNADLSAVLETKSSSKSSSCRHFTSLNENAGTREHSWNLLLPKVGGLITWKQLESQMVQPAAGTSQRSTRK